MLSLGAGVQSSTLLLMAVHGEISIDRAIFADTQWESSAVYDWLEMLVPVAERAGIPVDIVTAGNLVEDSLSKEGWRVSMPAHIRATDGRPAMLQRKCTEGYKLRPIRRRLRDLGVTRKHPAQMCIGISLDEAHRMKPSRVQYIRNEWPLVDRRMTRQSCLVWLERRGYPKPPKSACIGCPFRDDRSWRWMRDEQPEEWAMAVTFDQQVRNAARMKQTTEAFLHRSLVPLPMVDLSTQQDAGQLGLFDAECEGMCGV